MRTRRPRKRYTWFPTIGSAPTNPENADEFNGRGFKISVAPGGVTSGIIFPVIPDVPLEGDDIDPDAGGQLVQSIGQEYIIERIVGNVFLHHGAALDDPPTVIFPKSALVGCGFFVARAEDRTAGGPNVPIGSLSATEIVENYSTIGLDTIREPWMWRRTWVLSSGRLRLVNADIPVPFQGQSTQVAGTGFAGIPGAPTFNGYYGARDNGPFFDIKSVRRVRNDERLWFGAFARTLDDLLQRDTSQQPNALSVDAVVGYLDVRVLGALRKAKASSAF